MNTYIIIGMGIGLIAALIIIKAVLDVKRNLIRVNLKLSVRYLKITD